MDRILNSENGQRVFIKLFPYILEETPLSVDDKRKLLNYKASSYTLIGLVGHLTHNIPKIRFGKICNHTLIKEQCLKIEHRLNDLQTIADTYMEIEHSEADEFVFRKVMLEYPRNRINERGDLIQ